MGGSICRILRGLEAPGSSICRILRVWEVLGGSIYRILRVWKALGGSTCCILRVRKALGDSICRILRGLEGPASNEPNQPKVPGGSAKQNEHSGIGGPMLGAWGGWK